MDYVKSEILPNLVLLIKPSKNYDDMAKLQLKPINVNTFGGLFSILGSLSTE